ncbi:multidrug transporter, partial [Lactobacillus sp. UMNPBX18]
YLLLSLFLLIELLMGMMSGQISATSNEAIYGESNKSTMLSTVSFIAEILVSLSLFVSNAIMKLAGNLKVMFFVSAAYFSIILLIIPLIKQKEELSTK